MAGIFGEFFVVSVSCETKHENSLKNPKDNSGENPGRKFEKIRGTLVLQLLWPNNAVPQFLERLPEHFPEFLGAI